MNIKLLFENFPVYRTFLKYSFFKVSFSILPTYPIMIPPHMLSQNIGIAPKVNPQAAAQEGTQPTGIYSGGRYRNRHSYRKRRSSPRKTTFRREKRAPPNTD
jgi:hypothetical protein